jgi:hypothetical protein
VVQAEDRGDVLADLDGLRVGLRGQQAPPSVRAIRRQPPLQRPALTELSRARWLAVRAIARSSGEHSPVASCSSSSLAPFFTPCIASSSSSWLTRTTRASATALSVWLGGLRCALAVAIARDAIEGTGASACAAIAGAALLMRSSISATRFLRKGGAVEFLAAAAAGVGREGTPSFTSLSRVRRSVPGIPGRAASSRAVSQVLLIDLPPR